MRKFIAQLLQNIFRFISGLVEQMEQYAKNRQRQNTPVTASIDAGQEELPAVEEMTPLAVERPMIQVECTSCGSVVELAGICQRCREPVCSRVFCWKDAYDEEMDMWVIRCRNCAATT